MAEESFAIQILKPITTYVLLPLWFAILIYIITGITTIKKGISLREGVHHKTFWFVAITALLWLVTLWLPNNTYLPGNSITYQLFIGMIATIMTLYLGVFYFSELVAPENTLRELAIGAGITNTKLSLKNAIKMFKNDEDAVKDSAAMLMLTNTATILRNFIVMVIIGIFFKVFNTPPLFFWVSMISMAVVSVVAYFLFNWKSQKEEAEEYSFFSPKETIISVLLFFVFYQVGVWIFTKLSYVGLYMLTAILGVAYGGMPLFIIVALLLAKKVSVMVALYAVIIGTVASVASSSTYAFIGKSRKLGIYLAIAEASVILVGIGTLLVLA
jgi:uncharacterized membrane protein (DUF4010 family)